MADISPPGADDAANDCPELDDNFFNSIGHTYDVVDAWTEKDDKSSDSRSRSRAEADDKRRTKTRTESERSRDSGTRKERTRSRSPRRRRRTRSPIERRRTRSPINRRPAAQNNSVPQWRKKGPPPGTRPSFLEEISQKFPELTNTNQNVHPGFNNPGMMYPGMNQQISPMGGPGYMQPGFMQPQYSGPMGMDPFGQPYPLGTFNNQIINPMDAPMMMPGQSGFAGSAAPLPVPAPSAGIPLQIPAAVPGSSRSTGEVSIEQAKNKAFKENKISLTEFLKQCSQKKAREETELGMSLKKKTVYQRCKHAADLLEELTKTPGRAPFVMPVPSVKVSSMRSDPSLSWKSPLVASDTSSLFMMQARLSQSRDALQAHPLRNIDGKLLTLTRNMKIDVVDMSMKIQRKIDTERDKESKIAAVARISHGSYHPASQKSQQGTQTDVLTCATCKTREDKKFKPKSVQTEEIEDVDVFAPKINVKKLTSTQQRLLEDLCKAFDIVDSRFDIKKRQWDSDDDAHHVSTREREDRMSYANPENPNSFGSSNFISLSPLKPKFSEQSQFSMQRRSRSVSPRGSRNRSQSPRGSRDLTRSPQRSGNFSRSPVGFRDESSRQRNRSPSLQRMRNLPLSPREFLHHSRSPQRSRNLSRSPLRPRNHSPRRQRFSRSPNEVRIRRSRSNSLPRNGSPKRLRITDRLGKKVESPMGNYRRFDDGYPHAHSSGIDAYRIPTPMQGGRYGSPPPEFVFQDRDLSPATSGSRMVDYGRPPSPRYRLSRSPDRSRVERRGRF